MQYNLSLSKTYIKNSLPTLVCNSQSWKIQMPNIQSLETLNSFALSTIKSYALFPKTIWVNDDNQLVIGDVKALDAVFDLIQNQEPLTDNLNILVNLHAYDSNELHCMGVEEVVGVLADRIRKSVFHSDLTISFQSYKLHRAQFKIFMDALKTATWYGHLTLILPWDNQFHEKYAFELVDLMQSNKASNLTIDLSRHGGFDYALDIEGIIDSIKKYKPLNLSIALGPTSNRNLETVIDAISSPNWPESVLIAVGENRKYYQRSLEVWRIHYQRQSNTLKILKDTEYLTEVLANIKSLMLITSDICIGITIAGYLLDGAVHSNLLNPVPNSGSIPTRNRKSSALKDAPVRSSSVDDAYITQFINGFFARSPTNPLLTVVKMAIPDKDKHLEILRATLKAQFVTLQDVYIEASTLILTFTSANIAKNFSIMLQNDARKSDPHAFLISTQKKTQVAFSSCNLDRFIKEYGKMDPRLLFQEEDLIFKLEEREVQSGCRLS